MQRSFDDLGSPLFEVTFAVIDLETTGAGPESCAITEVGAVKYRGGECLGVFHTLVNPGAAIPPAITYLTGITEAMVGPAPRIEAVLPSLLEFVGDAVIVGHNVRFDLSFLGVALRREGYGRLGNRWVDTCALARRLIRDEVPNCKLSTLANHFRLAVRPTHRALDDAKATAELLHCLLERAGCLGVLALEDLLELPTINGHPELAKLTLTRTLPRAPGVYIFRDAGGRPLYVGKAVDLRRRVRSYFTGDERRKVGQLLREAHAIDHIVCSGELEAAVSEVRLIHEMRPRFNRQAKVWDRYAYLKLTLGEAFPRLSVTRVARAGDGAFYLGPVSSSGLARTIAEAIETVVPLRRCTARLGRRSSPTRAAPCAPAQLGVAHCPCAGTISPDDYAVEVERARRGLTEEPAILLEPLRAKMLSLARDRRFEEAAAVRDRGAALARALTRQRRLDGLRRAGRLVVEVEGEGGAVIDGGRLVRAWNERGESLALDVDTSPAGFVSADTGPSVLPRETVDEVLVVSHWLESRAGRLRILSCAGPWTMPVSPVAGFETRRGPARDKDGEAGRVSGLPTGRSGEPRRRAG